MIAGFTGLKESGRDRDHDEGRAAAPSGCAAWRARNDEAWHEQIRPSLHMQTAKSYLRSLWKRAGPFTIGDVT